MLWKHSWGQTSESVRRAGVSDGQPIEVSHLTWTTLDTLVVILGVALAGLAIWTLASARTATRFREVRTAVAILGLVFAVIAVTLVVVNAALPPIT